MAFEFFDYDPLTGVMEYLEFSADGKTFSIRQEQDIEPYLDFAAWLRNTQIPDGNFRKEGWLYGLIPPIMQAQLFKKGINFMDPNDTPKVIEELNTNYPYFKTTHRHHETKR